MKRLPVAALAFAGALFTTACEDQPTSPRPALLPHAAISDAANGGANSAIYFLPPVTDQPNIVGQFNPNLTTAVIRICKMVNGACTEVVASFGAGQSTGPIVIASNQYLALWHVASSNPAVIVGAAYRIEVFTDDPGSDLSAVPEAWADVQAVNSGKEFKNLKTNDIVPLLPNGSLPIKVWIGSDVRCESDNCVSEVVDNGGGTLVLESGNGALLLQDGWLPPGLSNVTVTLQRFAPGPNNECVGKAAFTGPGLLAQREACLQVTTDPVIVPGPTTGIQRPAFIYVCTESDEESDPLHEFLQIFKADDGRPLEALKDVSHAELLALGFEPSCEGTPSDIGMSAHPLVRLAARGLNAITRPVARLLEVKPLYAIDLGQGGEIGIFGGFSYFTLGVQAIAARYGETPATAPVGTSVALSIQLTGLTVHPPGEGESEPLENVDVTFTVTEGDGGVTDGEVSPAGSITVQTGSGEGAGIATVYLEVAAGTNVVEAVAMVDGEPVSEAVTFTIEGTEALIACAPESQGADLIFRGWYIPSFPGVTLVSVELDLLSRPTGEGSAAGTYTFDLTARTTAYDGPVVGTSRAIVTLDGASTPVSTTFEFPAPAIPTGSLVTFSLAMISAPPNVEALYGVAGSFDGDPSCPIIETEDTTAPLSTFRRQGIVATIVGGAAPPPPIP